MKDALRQVLGLDDNLFDFLKEAGKKVVESFKPKVQQAIQSTPQKVSNAVSQFLPGMRDLASNAARVSSRVSLPRLGGLATPKVSLPKLPSGEQIKTGIRDILNTPIPRESPLGKFGSGVERVNKFLTTAPVISDIGYKIPSQAGKNIADLIISAKEQAQTGKPSEVAGFRIPAKVAVPGKLALAGLNLTPIGVAGTYASEIAERSSRPVFGEKSPIPTTLGLVAGLLVPGGEAQDAARLTKLSKIAEEAKGFKSANKFIKALNESGRLEEVGNLLKGTKVATVDDFFNAIKRGSGTSDIQTLIERAKMPTETITQPLTATEKSVDEFVQGVKSKVRPNSKERGFITSVKEAPITAPEVAAKIGGQYKPITNVETLEDASALIEGAGWDVAKQAVKDSPLTAQTNLVGQELMRRAQLESRFDEAVDIAETLAKKGTEAGQGVQAFSVWSRLTPEGMLKYASNTIQKANKEMGFVTQNVRKLFGKSKPELTSEDAALITNLMQKANAAGSEEEKAKFAKLAIETIQDKVPWGVSDTLDFYRYNNLLSSPLTHLRNAWNNAFNSLVLRPGSLVFEGKPMEAVRYEIGALKAIPDAIDEFTKVIKGETPLDLAKLDVQKVRVPKNKVGQLYAWPQKALEGADKFFSEMVKQGELASGKTLSEATKAAEYFLLRTDLNPAEQGYLFNALDRIPKALYEIRKIPVLGWTVPFVRTPFNAAKMWLEYSPAGVLSIPGAADKRAQVGKALFGSMASLIGMKAATEGRTTWAAPTDPEQKDLFYATGRKPFSIQVGGKWIPMATFGGLSWALALPAAVKYFNDDSRTALTDSQFDKLAQSVFSLVGFWSQSTPMSGLGSFVKLMEGDIDFNLSRIAAQTASQLVPETGLMRYITQVLDPIYRRPEGFVENLKSGIPGLSQTIEKTYEDPTGEPSKRNIFHYFTPYGVGIPVPEWEPLLEGRTQELQENALLAEIKKGASRGGDVILGTPSTNEVEEVSGLSGIADIVKRQGALKDINQQMEYYYQNPSLKPKIEEQLAKIGVSFQDANYNYISGLDTNSKVTYLEGQGLDHNSLIEVLKEGRKESITGKRFAADGVIDEMFDLGYITASEKKALKKLKINQKGERIGATSGSGTGGLTKTQYNKALKLLQDARDDIAKTLGTPPKSESYTALVKETGQSASSEAMKDYIKRITQRVPKSWVDTNFETPDLKVDSLIAKSKLPGFAVSSQDEVKRIMASLRGGGSTGNTPSKLSSSFFKVSA